LNPNAALPHLIGMPRRLSLATAAGLFIALFAMLISRQIVNFFSPELTFAAAIWKESLIWISAAILLFIVRRGEKLPFSSVGFSKSKLWKSILWSLPLTVVCLAVALVLVHLTGFGHGRGAEAFEKLPLWLVTLIVIRAGVVEELFYRGYAIERLQALGLGRFWSALIPLAIFSVGHWTGGWANIVIAFVLGLILAVFYLWRRDIVSNMIGHGMVDFIGNVIPRLFS
jgi:membrane protease YdiL (CAAX protease family)